MANTPKGELVAWTTGAGGTMEVRAALGKEGTFGLARVLVPSSDQPVGRVDLVSQGSEVFASWLGADGIWSRRLDVSGGEISGGAPVKLADASAARGTEFPRSAVWDGALVTVWTDKEGLVSTSRNLHELPAAPTALQGVSTTAVAKIEKRPELIGQTLSGAPWSLGSVRGPLLVALWASWCGPCRAELPALRRLAAEHPDFSLVVIAVDEEAKAVQRVASERPGTWVTAKRKDAEQAFRTAAIPASWLFDEGGSTAWSVAGPIDAAEAIAAVRSVQ